MPCLLKLISDFISPKKVEENSIPNGKVGDAKKPVETKPPAAAKRTAGKKEPPKPAEPEKPKSEPPEIVGKLVDLVRLQIIS